MSIAWLSNRTAPLQAAIAVCAVLVHTLLQPGAADAAATPHGLLDPAGGALLLWFIGHCDTMDGPIIAPARKALDTSNVDLVLPWVPERDEPAVRAAFDHTLQVRETGPAARELADRYFFETLVRIHRAGEGAPYTGLKPAGLDLGPAVPAADRALETGTPESVIDLVTDAVRRGIHERHARATQRRRFDPHDVRAGRAYVEAYVDYVHYVERLHEAATGASHHQHAEDGAHGAEHAHVH
jgi:hypothetical protein